MKERLTGSILVVEDSETRIVWFRENLPHARVVLNPADAIAAIRQDRPETVFLDFDLGLDNSLGVAQLLAEEPPTLCVIHSANEAGAALLSSILPAAIVLPYASFKIRRDATDVPEIVWSADAGRSTQGVGEHDLGEIE